MIKTKETFLMFARAVISIQVFIYRNRRGYGGPRENLKSIDEFYEIIN